MGILRNDARLDRPLFSISLVIALLSSAAAAQGRGRGRDRDREEYSAAPAVVIVFSPQERGVITDWFQQNRNGLPPGLAKRESLPPGLQKQLQRNGSLPPGLEKKLAPLPPALEVGLGRLPADCVRVLVGRDLILLDQRRNVVLDIIPDVIRPVGDDRGYQDNDRDENRRQQAYVTPAPAPPPGPATAPSPSRPAWHVSPAPVASTPAAQSPFELKVRMTKSLSTQGTQSGDRFVATLEDPIYEGTRMIARKGAQVEGQVSDSDKGGRVSGVASLTLNLLRIQTVNGKYSEVTSDPLVVDANATKGKDVTKIAIGTGLGSVVGALAGGGKGAAIGAASGAAVGTGVVLATRGDPAVIPNESLLKFVVRNY